MGRPTVTRKYPLFFLDVLDQLKTQDVLKLHYATKQQAKSVQMDFLAFKNAALKEGWDQSTPIPSQNSFHDPEVIPAKYPMLNAYKTRCFEADGLWWVEIYDMDHTALAMEMQRQLEAMKR